MLLLVSAVSAQERILKYERDDTTQLDFFMYGNETLLDDLRKTWFEIEYDGQRYGFDNLADVNRVVNRTHTRYGVVQSRSGLTLEQYYDFSKERLKITHVFSNQRVNKISNNTIHYLFEMYPSDQIDIREDRVRFNHNYSFLFQDLLNEGYALISTTQERGVLDLTFRHSGKQEIRTNGRIIIDPTFIEDNNDDDATEASHQTNLVFDSEGNIYGAYKEGNNIDIINSSDGKTWSVTTLTDPSSLSSLNGVILMINSLDHLFVAYTDTQPTNDELHMMNSTNGGVTWSSPYTLLDVSGDDMDNYDCTIDGNDVIHCAGGDSAQNQGWYANSTDWDPASPLQFSDDQNDMDFIDIQVDKDNNPIFFTQEGSGELGTIYYPKGLGWGVPLHIFNNTYGSWGTSNGGSFYVRNVSGVDHVLLAAPRTSDLWIANFTLDNIQEVDVQEIDSDGSNVPHVYISPEGRGYISYNLVSGVSSSATVYVANSTPFFGEWDIRREIIDGGAQYASLHDGKYPSFNQPDLTTGNITFVYTDNSAGTFYHGFNPVVEGISAPDTTPPDYSLINEPTDPSTYVLNAEYYFNSTWTDDTAVDTVLFNWNGTNYTTDNPTGNIYNFTVHDIAVGTYTYYWWANDTNGNENVTSEFTFTVNQASATPHLTLNNQGTDLSLTYADPVTVVFSSNSTQSSTLYRNGTDVNSENDTARVLGTGFYNYTVVVDANENYTGGRKQLNLTVNQNSSSILLEINQSSSNHNTLIDSDVVLEAFRNTGEGNITLYEDDVLLASNTSIINITKSYPSTGTYTIVLNYTGTQNYTFSTVNYTITVSEAADTFSPNWSSNITDPASGQVYSGGTTLFNVSWQDDTALDTVVIEHNFTGTLTNYSMDNVSAAYTYSYELSVGSYVWRSFANDSSGNENVTNTFPYVLFAASSTTTISINKTHINYTDHVNVTCSNDNNEANPTLYLNGSIISEGAQVLGGGYYNFTCITADSQNYTGDTDTDFVLVDAIDPGLSIDLSPSDSEEEGTETISTGNGCPGGLSCGLFRDDVSVSNPDTQTLSEGSYVYIYNTTGNQNYTFATVNDTLMITADVTDPSVTLSNPADEASQNTLSVTYEWSVTDNIGADYCTLYDNSTGSWAVKKNISSLGSNPQSTGVTYSNNVSLIWNIICYDAAENADWGNANFTLSAAVNSTARLFNILRAGNATVMYVSHLGDGWFNNTLIVVGNVTFQSYAGCTLKTDALGNVFCGSDNTGGGGGIALDQDVNTTGSPSFVNVTLTNNPGRALTFGNGAWFESLSNGGVKLW